MSEYLKEYSHSLPGQVVWILHIIVGIFFMVAAWKFIERCKNSGGVDYFAYAIGFLGALMFAYHISLWIGSSVTETSSSS